MNVLITGGAGYIGSVTVRCLLDAGHTVIVIDNLSAGHRAAVPLGARFFQCDLQHVSELSAIMEQSSPIDCIIHFASHASVSESMKNPVKYFGDNMLNALNLLEIASQHHIQRFIFSSTCNLFDNNPANHPHRLQEQLDHYHLPISENQTVNPGSPYGESKYLVERLLSWYHKIYGLRYICLRYFNAAGAMGDLGEDHRPETHLIPLALQVALNKRSHIEVYGNDYPTPDGTCIRDFVHVADIAQAHLLALQKIDELCENTFHIGSGRGYSVLEVLETCSEVTGQALAHQFLPRRKGDPAFLVADIQKAQQMLNWQPKCSTLREIIQSAWTWHVCHSEGY